MDSLPKVRERCLYLETMVCSCAACLFLVVLVAYNTLMVMCVCVCVYILFYTELSW